MELFHQQLYCHSGEISSFGRIQDPSCKSTPSPKPQRHHRHVVEMACDLINLWEHQVVSNNHRLKPMSGFDPGRLKKCWKGLKRKRTNSDSPILNICIHLQVFSLSEWFQIHTNSFPHVTFQVVDAPKPTLPEQQRLHQKFPQDITGVEGRCCSLMIFQSLPHQHQYVHEGTVVWARLFSLSLLNISNF